MATEGLFVPQPPARCAMLMALSTLLEGGDWPSEALESMSEFMTRMREEIVGRRLN